MKGCDLSSVGGYARYLMVGTYTWLVPLGDQKQKEEADVEVPAEAPRIEAGVEDGEAGAVGAEDQEAAEVEDEPPPEGVDALLEGESEADEKDLGPIPDDMEVRVFRMVLPLPSKRPKEIIKAVSELVMRLRADGHCVHRVHTDRGKEFMGAFPAWVMNRGFVLSRTAGEDPRANGRAEVAVQYVKGMIRKALHEAQCDAEQWPLAARFVNEVLRCRRRGDEVKFPKFMEPVLVRKRNWRRDDVEAVSHEVRYICPAWSDHGHWVLRPDKTAAVTRYVLKPAPRREVDQVWLALEEDDERHAMDVRRRLRGKQAARSLHLEDDDEVQRLVMKERIYGIIEEEMRAIMDDPEEAAQASFEKVAQLKKLAEGMTTEIDEVLQTRIVSVKEVTGSWEQWVPALDNEVKALIDDKQALRRLSPEEYKELREKARLQGKGVEELPSKMVWAVKPDPAAPMAGKKKARWVICGNFETEKPEQDNYSGGADSTALRIMVKKAAVQDWDGLTMDVKTAFLNAELNEEEENDYVVIKPPHVLVSQGYFKPEDRFLAVRAVYGLRRSPRLWGKTRDRGLRGLQVTLENGTEVTLEPLLSEPNLWKVVPANVFPEATVEEIVGLLMTYVDDLFAVGKMATINAVAKGIRALWATTSPEYVSAIPVRFLGMEISREYQDGQAVWYITQASYLKDMLKKDEGIKRRKIPITRDQAMEIEEDGLETEGRVELVREAQKCVGELLWAVTRSRPDIMFAVSKMGSGILRNPAKGQKS